MGIGLDDADGEADALADGVGDAMSASALLGRLTVVPANATTSARPATVSMNSFMQTEVPYVGGSKTFGGLMMT